jgi:hypothetical protein
MTINHLTEHEHAFVRTSDNRVVQVATFADHDVDNLEGINRVVEGDTYVVCGCNAGVIPPLHSTWDGITFTPADNEYLISIGLLTGPEDN